MLLRIPLTAAAIVTAAAVALTTTGGALPRTTAAATATRAAHWTGEEVFRATAFGQGPLATELGGLVPDVPQTPEVTATADALVAEMSRLEPGFFRSFARETQSGDAYRVQDAFTAASGLIERAADGIGLVDGSTGEPTERWAAIQLVLFAVAGAVYAYAAVLQVQAVATKTVWASRADGDTSLARERWLAQLTTALAR